MIARPHADYVSPSTFRLDDWIYPFIQGLVPSLTPRRLNKHLPLDTPLIHWRPYGLCQTHHCGDYVVATARSLNSFDELRQDPKIFGERLKFLALDVTSSMAEIRQCVDEALGIWRPIDVLVNNNNAGTLTYDASEEHGAEALPHMLMRCDGTIISIGSRSAYRTQMVGMAFIFRIESSPPLETLAVEFEWFNIRVMIAAPGSFATKFNGPTRSGTPYAKLPKGDPALGMDALVDVVRGPPRLAFPRGGFYAGRARAAEKLSSTLEEWKDVGSNLGLPDLAPKEEFANVIDINTFLPSTIHVLGFGLEVASDPLNDIDLTTRTIISS
ncbi:hypothetical protein BC826DRAFT_1105807 [Russula brevipes]|nr:hypothetical protein BC826DRAFT_1105807 [Russula brevipes]